MYNMKKIGLNIFYESKVMIYTNIEIKAITRLYLVTNVFAERAIYNSKTGLQLIDSYYID